MSSTKKRPGSPSISSQRTGKRRAPVPVTHAEPIVISDDDDDDPVEVVFAHIKEQEQSEALAKKLQDEWRSEPVGNNFPTASSSRVEDDDVIIIDSGTEDDEALARRLEMEWAQAEPSAPSYAHEKSIKPPWISPKGKSKKAPEQWSSIGQPDTPDEKLRQCRSLFVAERECSKCGSLLKSPSGHVMFSTSIPPPSLVHLLHIHCRACNINHCRGCMKPNSCPVTCKGVEKNPNCTVDSCCAEVRAIGLFEALGGFDRQYLGEKASSAERARASAAKNKEKSRGTVGPGGTGYGNDSTYNVGWHSGPNWRGDARGGGRGRGRGRIPEEDHQPSVSYASAIADHWEEIITRAFATFTRYLPDPYSEFPQTYDMIPHQSIQPLLNLSQLPEMLGSLLRNDSVTDWINRSDTYHAMLNLLRRMADCELTIEVLISDGWEKSSSCGLQEWMWQDGEIKWELDGHKRVVRTSPLYNHFKKLSRQCEAFLTGASQLMDGDNDEEVEETAVKGTSLCGDMIAAREHMDRVLRTIGKLNNEDSKLHEQSDQKSGSKAKGKAKDSSFEQERAYGLECERLAFHYVTMSESDHRGGPLYSEYNYSDMVKATANQTRLPKDRLHLVKELAVTATCLPPGVWVRVDEVRNDVLKIMIAGPEGTPYAGGLFEFDCFLPINYPNSPPLMHLRTTGGGRVRFNPNLYNSGKVCLSLLGTWPGRPEEQWSPRNSTLLQVLVSIQSMIFIDTPYFNEPGFGPADAKAPKSINYNRGIRLQTVRFAMVEWMQDKYKPHIWADVIASHFGLRNEKIRKCIHEWAKEDPQLQNYTESTTSMAGVQTVGGSSWGQEDWDDDYSTDEEKFYQKQNARRRIHPAPRAPKNGQDLLVQYDQGIERIGKWSERAASI